MRVSTESMHAYTVYMQGRAVGNTAKFTIEEPIEGDSNHLVMEIVEDNKIPISVRFISEDFVVFVYENEEATLTKTVSTVGAFISAMIEFTQKPAEHFDSIIANIGNNPIADKPYTVYYKYDGTPLY